MVHLYQHFPAAVILMHTDNYQMPRQTMPIHLSESQHDSFIHDSSPLVAQGNAWVIDSENLAMAASGKTNAKVRRWYSF